MATSSRSQQHHAGGGQSVLQESTIAVPSLKVMRLQKPELDVPKAGSLSSSGSLLGSSLCLPDSFGVIHVGETFTAYLGALNVSKRLPVRKLTVTAQLQTPSVRWHLASETLDECNAEGGCELLPGQSIDAIVSHALEEAGQHILRVEVGYGGEGGAAKSLRKFYRFQVSNPLALSARVYRIGGSSCFVSVALQNKGHELKGGLMVSSADFEPAPGLVAEKVDKNSMNQASMGRKSGPAKGVDLFDSAQRLEANDSNRYLFKVSESKSASGSNRSTKRIAAGDQLGQAIFTWQKACGEMGRMASSPILCPILDPILEPNNPVATMKGTGSDFVVHIDGNSLPVDVAEHARARALNPSREKNTLDLILPITVEPVNPPKRSKVGIPFEISFSIVNHSQQYMTPQLQFRLEHMKGIAVCGPSYKNLDEIRGNGGSSTVSVRFISLSLGLAQLTGCCIVNLGTGDITPQPPLANILVVAE